MKSTSILVALFAICGLWLTPNTTEAASGYILNDTTAVFFLDFTFSSEAMVFGVPVLADHAVGYYDRVDVVGYELTNADAALPEIKNVSDLIVSSAPLQDARYTVAEGESAMFTLVSIVTFIEPIETELTATITKLPYWFDGTRTTVHQNQLDELSAATATF